jgi:hypothetical protein
MNWYNTESMAIADETIKAISEQRDFWKQKYRREHATVKQLRYILGVIIIKPDEKEKTKCLN